ncbi:hypothetical protein GD1_134 [Paraglaciecola Antarctic GD virus 1]|nr:hypothetical protein GD1_134 [Paraglaciecola Antarctic GD virus 1]
MIINQDSIDNIEGAILDFLVGKALGFTVKVAYVNDISSCMLGEQTYTPSNDLDYVSRQLIPHLVVTEGTQVITVYTQKFIESSIKCAENINFFGYGSGLEDSLCRAFVLFKYNDIDVEIERTNTIH